MKKVYLASASALAKDVVSIQQTYKGSVTFISTWAEAILSGEEETPENACLFWQEDLKQIQSADCLLLWAPPDYKLRGALVEAGMALALGKPVFTVGEHPDYSTWQYHPLVTRCLYLSEAILKMQE